MAETHEPEDEKAGRELEDAARDGSQGVLRELLEFLRHEKKWWLTPILVVLLLVGLLVVLGSTAAAPFIYTLF
jgi:hypothetical protein